MLHDLIVGQELLARRRQRPGLLCMICANTCAALAGFVMGNHTMVVFSTIMNLLTLSQLWRYR